MNSTQRRLSAAAWAMLEALSRLRKSVQKELDFLLSISPSLKSERLESILWEIDEFSATISKFLATVNEGEETDLEGAFGRLNDHFEQLTSRAEAMLTK
ncbi:MAG: hypothetical protein MUC59_18240 [Saprospiraceae bacterium]|jgi:hypothetical protein|nr:hypothetical protein [Saprospiraceae bacterium]